MHLDQVAIIVDDYDDAIRFFVNVLGFELVEDAPSLTSDGRPKRWVLVRPPGARTALLLVRADGERQARAVGDQFAGRVGLFLRVDDFDAAYDRMRQAGVEFLAEPRSEPYGLVAGGIAGTCSGRHPHAERATTGMRQEEPHARCLSSKLRWG